MSCPDFTFSCKIFVSTIYLVRLLSFNHYTTSITVHITAGNVDAHGSEEGWVVVEEMAQSHGVVNNGEPFSRCLVVATVLRGMKSGLTIQVELQFWMDQSRLEHRRGFGKKNL
jgi:hypothetical protein